MKVIHKKISRREAALKGWATRRAKAAPANQEYNEIVKNTTRKKVVLKERKDAAITKWWPNKSMSQIYSSGLEFAFVSPNGEQCHPFAYCKDFLQDAVWAYLHNKSVSIYQFTYDYKLNPAIDLDKCRMAVRLNKNDKIGSMCQKALKFLREIDEASGTEPTQLEFGGKYNGTDSEVWVFVADPAWQLSTVLLSFWTMAIRAGMSYEGGGWKKHLETGTFIGRNEKTYAQGALKVIDKIVSKKGRKLFAETMKENYPVDCTTGALHGCSGIVAFSRGSVAPAVKVNWPD